MASRYATGRRALGRCERCGDPFPLKELRYDGQFPDMLVCGACWDPKHPQERLPDVFDPVTLRDPTGDNEKFAATLQTVDYPPFIPGQPAIVAHIAIGVQPTAVVVVGEGVVDPGTGPQPKTQVTDLDLLGLPGA